MDPMLNGEWSLEEKEKFNEVIRDINLEGPECVEELVRRFLEKPAYQIRDQYVNFFVEDLVTENVFYDAKLDSLCIEALESENFDAKLDSLCIEAPETENFGLLVGETEDSATMPPSICEDVDESSRKRKNTEAGGEIGDALEEITKKKSNKGQPWTIEEHELFLHGLQKHGRGKWRMIAWEFVKTKTPAQVASHAQKYFERLKTPINKRQGSIHDIRLVDNSVVFNPVGATSKWNNGIYTNDKYAILEGNSEQFVKNSNYWQIASSNDAIPAENNNYYSNSSVAARNWQFASSSYIVPNTCYGRFATNLPQGGIFGPNGRNGRIFPESVVPFGGQQQNLFQDPWVFNI